MSNNEIENWEMLLESEGLGVIEVDDHWHGVGVKHITGKHRRLECVINSVLKESDGIMTNSPVTARAVETRFSDAESEQEDFDDGLWDEDEDGDDVWDMLILSLTGSPKEAEIADRRRSYALGIDSRQEPYQPKLRRLTKAQKVANIRARQRGEPEPYPRNPYQSEVPEPVNYAAPKPQFYLREAGMECAHTDAGGGPLAMVDRPKPDYGKPREDIRMSPVVDTLGYLPGRGPYQLLLAQGGRGNSDITG